MALAIKLKMLGWLWEEPFRGIFGVQCSYLLKFQRMLERYGKGDRRRDDNGMTNHFG